MNKADLLNYLKDNLAKHDEIYDEAVENYWKELRKSFDNRVKQANELINERDLSRGRVNINISINAPENHRQDYETAIRMFECDIEDTVELNQHEFEMYVLNRWTWVDSFLTSNSLYSAKANDLHAFHG